MEEHVWRLNLEKSVCNRLFTFDMGLDKYLSTCCRVVGV